MRFDTSQEGLHTLFRPYQAVLLEHIWDINRERRTGITSSQAYSFILQTGDRELMRSRAMIIRFLNEMVEEGLLNYEERKKKGGTYRVYFPKMSRNEFANHAVKTITEKLRETFPSAL